MGVQEPGRGNWHPLTMLSHMLDCQLFGLQPWGHHLTSLLLHALNTVLVFLLLRRLTGAVWRSVMVAACLAGIRCMCESVAWVAERKDVLSTAFGLLTLLLYVPRSGARFKARSARCFIWRACWRLRPGVDVQADAGDAAVRYAAAGLLASGAS